ncbi:carbon-nitrogen hydrolase family protein [Chitinilyticum piscinae]|uniref:Carbon-nitrogen hydrolase family protein n=1 Tax=Chitinilyticum piscinae TaxID=2866724 RepID=A0A8J7K1K5_9NEIS|nr:carbon-nitrogen hydrolase family protein [Chitinilyticum piscinae]MBE9609341.1 carbon-nitrogen hydrolase family protein [Chitinilyticum piscinae]
MAVSQFRTLRAAAIQMISGGDVPSNLADAARLLEKSCAAGAELAVLPEYFAILGARDTDKLAHAEPYGEGPLQTFLSQQAQKLGIWLVGGTIPLCSDIPGKVFNSTLVYDPQGNCQARYDKVHLFNFDSGSERFCESATIAAGARAVLVDTPFGRMGLAICYDLRFPELFRQEQADFWVLPAAFTATTGRAHWEVLLRARAIENQCFVIASGQGGRHASGRETFGHSMLIDPWGQVLECLDTGAGLVVAELKASQLERTRRVLPALDHRRL